LKALKNMLKSLDGKKTLVFVSSPLSKITDQVLNLKIQEVLEKEGFTCILPQIVLPPNSKIASRKIFNVNVALIKRCDVVLAILDQPGEGVLFELGVADALGKQILVLRGKKHRYLGKVVEGFLSTLPKSSKASSLDELRVKIRRFRKEVNEQFNRRTNNAKQNNS